MTDVIELRNPPEPILIEYIWGGRPWDDVGQTRIAVVVATLNAEGEIVVGWSRCHHRDNFDKKLGKKIAVSRALSGTLNIESALKIKADIRSMVDRAIKYFKGRRLSVQAADLMY